MFTHSFSINFKIVLIPPCIQNRSISMNVMQNKFGEFHILKMKENVTCDIKILIDDDDLTRNAWMERRIIKRNVLSRSNVINTENWLNESKIQNVMQNESNIKWPNIVFSMKLQTCKRRWTKETHFQLHSKKKIYTIFFWIK